MGPLSPGKQRQGSKTLPNLLSSKRQISNSSVAQALQLAVLVSQGAVICWVALLEAK